MDLRKRLNISKAAVESREREVLKREDETYKPKFWSYLDVCYKMVAFHATYWKKFEGRVEWRQEMTAGHRTVIPKIQTL